MRGWFADRNELYSAPEKKRAGRPLTWAGEGLGSLCFRTLVRNKARRPPAGFEMDQVGHPFTAWVGLAVLSIISFNGRKSASAGVYGRKPVCSNSNCSFGSLRKILTHTYRSVFLSTHIVAPTSNNTTTPCTPALFNALVRPIQELQPNLA